MLGGDSTPDAGKKSEWRLGPTSYSFRKFTFFDAIDKTKALGLHYIEPFEGHALDKNIPGAINRGMSDETIAKILRKLDDADVKITSVYVGHVPGDEAGCRKVFEFARKLGASTIISEPDPKHLDIIEKLCDEYEINFALHNHAKGISRYWNPREVLKMCEGRSPRLGVCADIGYWQRSGIKPADGVRILGKRILSFHIKDLNEFGVRKAHDVPWGTGLGGLQETIEEIDRQGIEPTIFGIEYEYHWENSLPEIAECVKFFRKMEEGRKQKTGEEGQTK